MGLDLRRYACAMDMVDSAFERADIRLFKRGIDYDVGGTFIALWRNEFLCPKITLTRITRIDFASLGVLMTWKSPNQRNNHQGKNYNYPNIMFFSI